MTAHIGLELEPLDLLFFRDGRPFEAGIRVGTTTILPQTIAGALRTALLRMSDCDFDALIQAVQAEKSFSGALAEQSAHLAAIAATSFGGPWLLHDERPLVPAPASLLRDDDNKILRLAPLRDEFPGWTPEKPGMLPLWTRSPTRAERVTGYLTLAGVERFLHGDAPSSEEVVEARELFEVDTRTGIVVSAERLTVEAGMIYSADYLALKPGVGLYVEVTGPEAVLAHAFSDDMAITVGGQARYVRVRRREPVQWPRVSTGGAGSLLLLTTPAPFAGGWRPPGLEIVAAAVPGHIAVSGWDLARSGPKPTRFAAQAGSVYFCRGEAPPGASLCEGEDGPLGWGRFLQGVWDYA